MKEDKYSKLDNYNCYLAKKQPNINEYSRGILLNWMMESASDFNCKR